MLLAAFVAREATARTPVPLRIFRSRNVTGANLIQVLSVAGMFGMFFLGALYLQDPRLRCPADRSRVPARHDLDGNPVGPLHRPPGHALWGQEAGSRRPRAVHGRARTVRAGAGRRRLRGPHLACDGPSRHRGRPLLPCAHDAGDVWRHAQRRGAGLGPDQHHSAGRRCLVWPCSRPCRRRGATS